VSVLNGAQGPWWPVTPVNSLAHAARHLGSLVTRTAVPGRKGSRGPGFVRDRVSRDDLHSLAITSGVARHAHRVDI